MGLALALVLFAIAFWLVRRSGYRDGLARAAELLLESWARDAKRGPTLEEGMLGEALRKILAVLGPKTPPGPILKPPAAVPCAPCTRGDHRACRGGWIDAGGQAACGCACGPDLA
jgi:hypothetical protein